MRAKTKIEQLVGLQVWGRCIKRLVAMSIEGQVPNKPRETFACYALYIGRAKDTCLWLVCSWGGTSILIVDGGRRSESQGRHCVALRWSDGSDWACVGGDATDGGCR